MTRDTRDHRLPGLAVMILLLLTSVLAGCLKGQTGNRTGDLTDDEGDIEEPPVFPVSKVLSLGAPSGLPFSYMERFQEEFQEELRKDHGSDYNVTLKEIGVTKGLDMCEDARLDFMMMDRPFTEVEKNAHRSLDTDVLFRKALVVIVNRENPVSSLSLGELADIYTGKVQNWKELGGPDANITVLGRKKGSEEHDLFRSMALDHRGFGNSMVEKTSDEGQKFAVSQNTEAIGFVNFNYLDESVKGININVGSLECRPERDFVDQGLYPLTRTYYLVSDFLDNWKYDFLYFAQREGSSILGDSCLIFPKSSPYHFFTVAASSPSFPFMEPCWNDFLRSSGEANLPGIDNCRMSFLWDTPDDFFYKVTGSFVYDAAVSSRPLSDGERQDNPGLLEYPLARDALVMVTHKDNPVSHLGLEELRDIYRGDLSNWSTLGGNKTPIRPVSLRNFSYAGGLFEQLVLPEEEFSSEGVQLRNDVGKVLQLLRENQSDLAYITYSSMDLLGDDLKILGLEDSSGRAVGPGNWSIRAGRYPLVREFTLLIEDDAGIIPGSFRDFLLDIDGPGQEMLGSQDYVRMDSSPDMTIRVGASQILQDIARELAGKYVERYPDTEITFSLHDPGVLAIENRSLDIHIVAGEPTEEEMLAHPELVWTPFGNEAIAVVTHPDNPVSNLSLRELRAVYTGETDNWQELGGPDEEIFVVDQNHSSGAGKFFRSMVMDGEEFREDQILTVNTSSEGHDLVQSEPWAIGFVGLGDVDSGLEVMELDLGDGSGPIKASHENIQTGSYPLARTLYFVTYGEPQESTADYKDFILDKDSGQSLMEEKGFIPLGRDTSVSTNLF